LLTAFDGEAVSVDVLGDHRYRPNDRTVADRHRGHQRAVRPYEGALADHRIVLAEPIVIAGDGARADVRVRADICVADVGQMVDLGARTEHRFLHLDEITDLRLLADFRTRPQAGEWTDDRLRRDGRALDVAERLDGRSIGNLDA